MTESRPARPDRNLTRAVRLRLLGAVIALTAGGGALVVAIVLARSALS